MIFEKIRELSDQKGISIRNLEQLAGLGNGTIKKWIKSNPTIENLGKVAKILNVPISELIADSPLPSKGTDYF